MRIEVLVGMIGSGKSTYARRRAAEGALVISHDDLTQMLHGGEYRYELGLRDCYRAMMVQLAVNAIVAGRDVIVDRTHLTRESRRMWIETGRGAEVPVIAVAFPIDEPEVHAKRRFLADPRGRPYEEWLRVAEHHHAQALAEPLTPLEGFAAVLGPEVAI